MTLLHHGMRGILSSIFFGIFFSTPAAQQQQRYPNGACSARSCVSTPIVATDLVASSTSVCWTMRLNPSCVDVGNSTCCETLTSVFQKIVLKSVPECKSQIAAVTVGGVVKAGGVYFETYGQGDAELRITNLLITNLTSADGMSMCIDFVTNSTCSDPDVFFGSSASSYYYSIYDPFRNVCCPTCTFQTLPFQTLPPLPFPQLLPSSPPPPNRPFISSPPKRPLLPRLLSPSSPPHLSPLPLLHQESPTPQPTLSPPPIPKRLFIPSPPLPRQSSPSPPLPPAQQPPPPQPEPPPSTLNCIDPLHFGLTCSVPLGKNCPWSSPDAVPVFFELSVVAGNNNASTLFRINQVVPTADILAYISSSRMTSGPITQVIFPFPPSSMNALVAVVPTLSTFVAKIESTPGSVTAVPTGVGVQILTVSNTINGVSTASGVSTRMGNVFGVTGYYVYKTGSTMWTDGDSFSIPQRVFDLVPKIKTLESLKLEYSFYGSEEYCKLQYLDL